MRRGLDFVNIDSMERLRRRKIALIRQSLRKVVLIAGLVAGIAGATVAMNHSNKAENARQQAAIEQQGLTKIYNSVIVKSGDTLTSIVNKVMEEYPDTANFYTTESMIKEVAKINHIANVDKLDEGEMIIIPYYIPIEVISAIEEARDAAKRANEEKAAALDDYEDYVVQGGDSYWRIAYKYTDDANEASRLMDEIQRLNGNENLKWGSTIKIPNIEKYKLLNVDYLELEEETAKTM